MSGSIPKRVPGAIAAAVGAVLLGLALLDPRDAAFEFGRLPVAAAALVFLLAGAALLLRSVAAPYGPALQTLFGTLVLAAFALLSGTVSLGHPLLMLFSFLPCAALTGLGLWATVRDFRAARRAARRARPGHASAPD